LPTVHDCSCRGWVEYDPDCRVRVHHELALASMAPFDRLRRGFEQLSRALSAHRRRPDPDDFTLTD
jgi:hypothetical protein